MIQKYFAFFQYKVVKMRALHIFKYGRFPELRERDVPKITSKDQVLVRMKYAPVNPSDINFFQGRYGVRKEGFPIPGFEGSGIIEEAEDKWMIGKHVSVMASMQNGTHSTHLVLSRKNLLIWNKQENFENISMCWINPFSCLGLFQIIRQNNVQSVVLTAAASQLNIMMLKYIKKRMPNLKVYGITRRCDFNSKLIQLGINNIFSTNDPFQQVLSDLQGPTAYLDCIGGELAGKIFNALPPSSILVSYGKLSGQSLGGIDTGSLYYKDKQIRGFWLNNWLKHKTQADLEPIKLEIRENFKDIFTQKIKTIRPLSGFEEAYRESIKNQSEGKVLLNLD